MRVVTLLPAATEIVAVLGVEPVGVSHECDHPPSAADAPTVVRSRVDGDADGATIDDQVAAASDDGGVYAIDRERLVALDPDLIVAQGVCSVCAVDRVQVADVVADLGLDATVATTDVHSLSDLYGTVRSLGAALDRQDRAEALVADLRERVDAVAERAPADDDRPRVAVLDWLDPVMVAGHWMPELVELAGGRYDLAATGERSRPREWDEIREYDPEVLVAAPCGFGLERAERDLPALTDRPGWEDLTAVREGRVWLVDGDDHVNRPGPRLVDTLEILAGVCHPDRFDAPGDAVGDGAAEASGDDVARRVATEDRP